MDQGRRVIFSDVDQTLIVGKSLIEFLDYLAASEGSEERRRLTGLRDSFRTLLELDVPREELNRMFYLRVLEGRRVETAMRLAQAWFADGLASGRFFKSGSIALVRQARESGHGLVLVSGSFTELLAPLAAYLGADDVLAAPLEIIDGHYTGRLLGAPVIGDGKADAVRAYALRHGIDLGLCCGIGDDLSDRAFLSLVGRAYVPSDGSLALIEHARLQQWRLVEAHAAFA
jgi:HAD superfamily hydrolase (TIGR01490 family)